MTAMTTDTRSERVLRPKSMETSLFWQDSAFGSLPPLVPVFESQNFLDVQSVFASTAIFCDPMDQHRDLGDWGIHPVEQP